MSSCAASSLVMRGQKLAAVPGPSFSREMPSRMRYLGRMDGR